MSERIKSQDLKNILSESVKKDVLKSLQNQLDICACAYYFSEILKDPSIYTYEDYYGAHRAPITTKFVDQLFKSKQDLGIGDDLVGAWDKVKNLYGTYGKNNLDDRRFYQTKYNTFWNEKTSVIDFFNHYVANSVCLIYMYRKSIPPKKLKVLEKQISNDMLIDLMNVMFLMEEKIKTIAWLLKLTKKRNKIIPGDVYYNGKKYSFSELGRISSNLKKAVEVNIQHSNNMSDYVYNYSSVIDIPIIISPLISWMGDEAGYVDGFISFNLYYFKPRKKGPTDFLVTQTSLKTSYMSLTPIIARRDSVFAILHTLAHESTHVWQVSTKRKYPKRWKRFENSWARYFNELNRLKYNPKVSSKVSLQQREDFVDGISDYVKIRKLKKYYELEVLETKKKYRFPSYESLSNMLLLMIVPSAYALSNPWELMAETVQFISTGDKNELGFGIDSDVPSFFVPAKRFLKLIEKYSLDK